MDGKWVVAGALGAAIGATCVAWGCGGEPEGDAGASGSGTAGAGGAASASGVGAGPASVGPGGLSGPGGGDGGLTEDSACVSQSSEATLVKKPVDVVIVIDNSGSMGNEIEGVVKNINQNFADIIEASGLDYRVIMVARYGTGTGVCVEEPLGGTPKGGCASASGAPQNNPPKFFQYAQSIGSRNAWCQLLTTFDKPDTYNLAPGGWSEWLRPDAYKTFIVVTDDESSCSVTLDGTTHSFAGTSSDSASASTAQKFDDLLLKLSPEHFGTAEERNYTWHSIIGVALNDPPTAAYPPTDPPVKSKCSSAVNPGFGHQALSILTGGLRFPLCYLEAYDAVFQSIAEGVIKGAQAACEFELPDPPPGHTLDLSSVVVQYTPGGGGTPTSFEQVSGAEACAPDKFYLTGELVTLCPETCEKVQGDDAAKISVLFDCKGKVN